jgi:RNA polymerase sigma-70 factor (ECF subfamily)
MHDFDALYSGHYTSLTTQLFAYFGDRQEAQDVVQEAFCRALARWKEISTYDDPVAWVRRVAWNLATSHVRRLKVATTFRRQQQPEYAPPPSPDRVALFAALKTLPARQRQATVMHYLADMPIDEIAAAMDVSVGTVKSWLHRARAALATELAPEHPPAAAVGAHDTTGEIARDIAREENRHA